VKSRSYLTSTEAMENKILKPYIKKIMGDLDTPISIYQKYVGDEIGILLESRDQIKGRYSIIGKNPFLTIKTISENITILEGDVEKKVTGKILDTIKEYMSKIEVKKENNDIPFLGGAVGTIGYDIIKQYENIPVTKPDAVGLPDAHLMFIKEMIVYDHFHQQILFIVLEEDNENGKINADKKIKEIEKELRNSEAASHLYKEDETIVGSNIKANTSKEEYMEMVKKAKHYIHEGDIFQVVLSQRWTMETNEDPFSLYRSLRSINPSPYLFYLNFGDYQVAGSSPELLVELKKDRIYTCPIAGTRKRGENAVEDEELAQDLLNDPKELAEHVMLVDLARNDMGRMAKIGTVEISEFMKVKNYSHVMHLVSLVEGDKHDNEDMFSILAAFLPAGTLSGAPKIRAMEIIEELEKAKRGIYGGAVGYFGFDGNMDTCIAIRTMVMAKNKVYMQAGAGITNESVPEKEYEECGNKVKALMKAIMR